MKNILVFGAAGRTGQQVVAQALAKGHTVTAFTREAGRLTVSGDRLRVVQGDTVDDPASVARVVPGHDVVISTLGVPGFTPNGLIERSMRNIIPAMEAAHVRRMILTSAFGVAETMRDVPVVPTVFMRTLLRRVYADKRVGQELLRRSALEWTIVCPTGLTDRPGTAIYRVGERLALRGFPSIPRADVAHFLVSQIDDRTYLNREILVSS